jgi:hypothetical protein
MYVTCDDVRCALELGALNALSYFVLTWDLRTVAFGNYFWAAVSNMAIALLGFTILKRVQESSGWPCRIAYAVGGTAGTMLGIASSMSILGR